MCIAIDWIFQYHTKKPPHSRSDYSRDPTSYLAEKSFYVERQKSSFDCMHQWTDFAGFLQNFFFYSVVVVDHSQILYSREETCGPKILPDMRKKSAKKIRIYLHIRL